MSIWHHNLYVWAVVGVLGEISGSQGLISRHSGRKLSSPPHQHQDIYSEERLNGHNLGLELLFSSCTQKIVFYGAISGFSQIQRKGSYHLSAHNAKLVQTTARRSTHSPKGAIRLLQSRAGPINWQDNTPILDSTAKCRILAPFQQ